MSVFLKVKAKSLAAEAAIIRIEERKQLKRPLEKRRFYDLLRDHRIKVVRSAARDTHLARMYLKGRDYRAVERTARETPDVDAIMRMVWMYGVHAGKPYADELKALRTWLGIKESA